MENKVRRLENGDKGKNISSNTGVNTYEYESEDESDKHEEGDVNEAGRKKGHGYEVGGGTICIRDNTQGHK